MQSILNFLHNPAVQNTAFKTSQVLATGALTGVISVIASKVLASHNTEDCQQQYTKPFAIGFVLGAALQTARMTQIFSKPFFTTLSNRIVENRVVSSVWSFFTKVI